MEASDITHTLWSFHGLITAMSSTWTVLEDHLEASASPECSGMSSDSMPWYPHLTHLFANYAGCQFASWCDSSAACYL